jgi:hypothetical protein
MATKIGCQAVTDRLRGRIRIRVIGDEQPALSPL